MKTSPTLTLEQKVKVSPGSLMTRMAVMPLLTTASSPQQTQEGASPMLRLRPWRPRPPQSSKHLQASHRRPGAHLCPWKPGQAPLENFADWFTLVLNDKSAAWGSDLVGGRQMPNQEGLLKGALTDRHDVSHGLWNMLQLQIPFYECYKHQPDFPLSQNTHNEQNNL